MTQRDEVEELAKKMRRTHWESGAVYTPAWEDLPERARNIWRDDARAELKRRQTE